MASAPPLYEEWRPPTPLAPLVACLWVQRVGAPRVQRVVPDACVDVMAITEGDRVRVEVAGPDTGPHLAPLAADTAIVGVRLRPGAAPDVLGLPLHALRDVRVPLADLWGRAVADELAERVAASPRPVAAAARAVLDRQLSGSPDGRDGPVGPDGRDGPALAEALAGDTGPGTVRQIADRLGLSERHLHRRCLVTFGYGPKTVQRVLRFQAALTSARQGRRLADVAAESGYADQAHMSRDVRALAGVPLTALLTP